MQYIAHRKFAPSCAQELVRIWGFHQMYKPWGSWWWVIGAGASKSKINSKEENQLWINPCKSNYREHSSQNTETINQAPPLYYLWPISQAKCTLPSGANMSHHTNKQKTKTNY